MALAAEDQAIQVLEGRLRETVQAIGPALTTVTESARALLDLLEQEDALSRAVDVIRPTDMPLSARHGRNGLPPRVRSRLRRSTEELLEARRYFDRVSATPSFFDAASAHGRSPTPSAGPPRAPQVTIEGVARELAASEGGRVAARDVARRLMEVQPGRYTHLRSAYGSVYAHLERNPLFDKVASGVFAFAGEEVNEDAPVALPQDGEGRADAD